MQGFNLDYDSLFSRNYGIFSAAEQARLGAAKVLIVGCGGIGGTVATILARAGVGQFVLVEMDIYTETNMNRQIACFSDTLGRNKAEVVAEQIRRINPAAQVEVHPRRLEHAELEGLMPAVDLVFPAADDLAFSVFVFQAAQRLGKLALCVVPAGSWATVSIIAPDSPPVEDIFGLERLASYDELAVLMKNSAYRRHIYRFYVPFAGWRPEYYERFIDGAAPPTQFCPLVWLCSALGAQEAVKALSGKWRPVKSPRYWTINQNRVAIHRVGDYSLVSLAARQRRRAWRILNSPLGRLYARLQDLIWSLLGRYKLAGTQDFSAAEVEIEA